MILYWFEFQPNSVPQCLDLGCGITARSQDDALRVLHERVPETRGVAIRRIVAGVKIDDLDPGHVLPNLGNYAVRGCWFPLGYD
ncbi:hypothetical protein GLE_3463 [Lysobacter enzymogenes]|uniref:Uncharacterized protein n=1 Tax=Lysobacter enzymogenes TaxID=69 RepID=A0A0S2DKN5_LYSEN|nr:hypothetical protein [Lysobacter enzymogenes]ALN58808.1 hypothetical protein GLE_3463 [Lysobacter enzymogenes]QCW27089.1 hypothetical protein FE772_17055 [Lysobacter enzymogenes]